MGSTEVMGERWSLRVKQTGALGLRGEAGWESLGNRPARRQGGQLPACLLGWSGAVLCGLLALLRLNVSWPGQTSHWVGENIIFCGAPTSREARIVSAMLGLDVSTWPGVASGSQGWGGQACHTPEWTSQGGQEAGGRGGDKGAASERRGSGGRAATVLGCRDGRKRFAEENCPNVQFEILGFSTMHTRSPSPLVSPQILNNVYCPRAVRRSVWAPCWGQCCCGGARIFFSPLNEDAEARFSRQRRPQEWNWAPSCLKYWLKALRFL